MRGSRRAGRGRGCAPRAGVPSRRPRAGCARVPTRDGCARARGWTGGVPSSRPGAGSGSRGSACDRGPRPRDGDSPWLRAPPSHPSLPSQPPQAPNDAPNVPPARSVTPGPAGTMNLMRVAIVGATGAVGRTMLEILQERDFPLDELSLLASERTAGTRLRFRDRDQTVGLLTPETLEGVDLALSSCGSAIAQTWVPQAAERGTTVIDNSSAFRMEPWAELVIPEVNPEAFERGAKVYAVPNCTIITALMALAPLHRAAGLKAVSLSSYQSVSGAGAKGVRELTEQVEKLHGMEDDLAHPDLDALPVGDVFGKTIAYNVLAKIDVFDPESGFTFEEIKVHREAKRLLSLPELDISATCVRVPVP